jgi:hypothetical protein
MRQKEAEFSYLILTKRLFCESFVPPVIALYGSNTPAGIRRANCLPGGEPILGIGVHAVRLQLLHDLIHAETQRRLPRRI